MSQSRVARRAGHVICLADLVPGFSLTGFMSARFFAAAGALPSGAFAHLSHHLYADGLDRRP